jgi:very-short-patch-repair endonuclease
LQYHATPSAYVLDRQRDNNLICEGITPVRFSSVDIENDIEGCIKTIEKIFGEYQTGKRIYYRNGGISYFSAD